MNHSVVLIEVRSLDISLVMLAAVMVAVRSDSTETPFLESSGGREDMAARPRIVGFPLRVLRRNCDLRAAGSLTDCAQFGAGQARAPRWRKKSVKGGVGPCRGPFIYDEISCTARGCTAIAGFLTRGSEMAG